MKCNPIITGGRRQWATQAIEGFQCRLTPALDDLSSPSDGKRAREAAELALSQIAGMRRVLDELQQALIVGCSGAGVLSIRQMAKLLNVSPATASRQARVPVQSVGMTSGRHLSDSELARRVASFYDWGMDDDGRFIAPDGKAVGADIAQAAAGMRERGWFYDPSVQGIGIQWRIMPSPYGDGPEQAADQVRKLLRQGMYWAYDANGRPAIRMRDGKTVDQVMEEFRTDPRHEPYRIKGGWKRDAVARTAGPTEEGGMA